MEKENLYITVVTCPTCKSNCGIAIDLNSTENKLECAGCGAVTEICLEINN